VVAVLLNAGDQVPVTPFGEVAGKVIAGAPLQIAAIGAKFGVRIGLTVTVNVAGAAHRPVEGAKL